MQKAKTSMQIVDMQGDKPKHIVRVYSDLEPDRLLEKVYQSLRGHLVNKKNGQEPAQIAEENDVQGESRGEEDEDQGEEEEERHKSKSKHKRKN